MKTKTALMSPVKLSHIFVCAVCVLLFCYLVAMIPNVNFNKPDIPDCSQVVKIVVKSVDDPYSYYDNTLGGWQGSGIFIDDNLILTAGHIVDDANDIRIINQKGEEYKATGWYLEDSDIGDIGLIFVDTNEIEPKARFDDPILGEDVWAFGNPFGIFPVLSKGIISAVDMEDSYLGGKNMLITDCPINPGNSGCPLFDADGNILGICSWGYIYSDGMTFFVKADTIKLMLEKYILTKKILEVK